ncbi:MAG TPA: glycosyltransferase family 39 protein [Candidatus Dormibacteraeota bacterium]|nr:glycosyltransferase family 39 protein [Candidatus Dormibacteraeota bacterium]
MSAAAAQLLRRRWRLGLGAVVAGIVVLHLLGLGGAPPGLYSDEASIGYNAWAVAHTGVDEHGARLPLFFQAFGEYKNPVYVYLLAPLTWALPLTPATERLPAALCSLGVVAAVAATAWRLTRSRPVLLATLLTAGLTPWLVVEGRVGFEVISMVLALSVALLCLVHLLEDGGVRWGLGAGLALGVSVYSYSVGRMLVALLTALLLAVLMPRRRLPETLAVMLPVVVAYLVLAVWSQAHPGALTGRFSSLSITADHPSTLVAVQRFVRNYATYVGAPFLATHGDANPRHSTGFGGMLLLGSLPAVLLGVATCLHHLRGPLHRVLLGGLLLAPVPAALTAEGTPHALRASAMLPFLLALAALGWAVLLPTLLDRRLRVAAVVLLVAAGGEAAAFERDLFVDWPGRAFSAFDSGEVDAIQRAHDLAAGHLVHLSTRLDQPYIQALFVLRPDPRDYLRRGLAAVGVRLTAPDRMGDDARAGDLLVLAAGDQPPPGAQPLFEEVATVGSPVITMVGPDSRSAVLVQVYRR